MRAIGFPVVYVSLGKRTTSMFSPKYYTGLCAQLEERTFFHIQIELPYIGFSNDSQLQSSCLHILSHENSDLYSCNYEKSTTECRQFKLRKSMQIATE